MAGTTSERPIITRRGILAVGAAVAAAVAAKQAALPVAAAPYNLQGNATNTSTSQTVITGNIGASPANTLRVVNTNNTSCTALEAHADNGQNGGTDGIHATGTGYGIYATGNRYAGVFGDTPGDSSGVTGLARGATSGYGVTGYGQTAGVAGNSSIGTGVYGYIDVGNPASGTVGVFGENKGNGAGGVGVLGIAQGSGVGVQAQSHGIGVYGLSDTSYGIVGVTTAGSPYSGITGVANTSGAAAFAGGTSNPAAYAAYFTGATVVNGDFTVVGGAKNAAVKHSDGSYRLLHCVEAPEPWFEDFGAGTLAGGKAGVALDPDFAAVVQAESYHVFLTPGDGVGALRFARRTAAGFAVEEIGGASSGPFLWRVAARRKDLGKVQRFAKFSVPQVKIPGLAELPKPPPSPKPPTFAPPNRPTDAASDPPAPPPQPATHPATTAAPASTTTPAPNPAPPPRP